MSTIMEAYNQAELTREQVEEAIASGELDLGVVVDKQLWDGRTFMRRNAGHVLRLSGQVEPDRLSLLSVALKDSDAIVREHVAAALAKVEANADVVVPPLLKALADPEEPVRTTARDSLDRVTERTGEAAIPVLIDALADFRSEIRSVAAELLLKYRDVAGPPLAAALNHHNQGVAREAYQTMIRLGRLGAPALIEALEERGRRFSAAQLLMRLPELNEAETKALAELAGSNDKTLADLVETILREVRRAGSTPVPPAPIEVEGFYDRVLNSDELGAGAEGASIDSLLAALRDGRPVARLNAAAMLAPKAEKAKGDDRERIAFALPALTRDEVGDVRRAGLAALRNVDHPAAVGPIVRGVADSDPSVAAVAHEAVEELGKSRPAVLLGALGPEQPGVCHLAVLEALVKGGKKTVDALQDALRESPNALAREMAAASLERMGKPAAAAVDTLVEALSDRVDAVRRAAASAIGFLATGDEAVVSALKKAARDGDPSVRVAASTAVARVTGTYVAPVAAVEAEPIAVAGFEDSLLEEETAAASAGDIGLERLMRALGDGRVPVRHNAALALTGLGAKAVSAAAPLAVAARDADPRVRRAAAIALGKLGGKAADSAVPALSLALADPEQAVAESARASLDGLGGDAIEGLVQSLDMYTDLAERTVMPVLVGHGKKAVKALTAALQGLSPRQRANAAFTLGRIGPDAKGATGALVGLLKDGADDVRAASANALALIGDDGAAVLEGLAAARKDRAGRVRRAAVHAVDRLTGALDEVPEPEPISVKGFTDDLLSAKDLAGDAKKIGVPRLIVALSDGRPVARHNAAIALSALGAKAQEAALPLKVAARDSDPHVRLAAVTALGTLGAEVADFTVGALVRALTDANTAVVNAARAALGELGQAAVPGLVAELDRDGDAAEPAIAALIGLGAKALPALVEALGSTSVRVRLNAVAALGRLGTAHAKTTRAPVAALSEDRDDAVRKAVKRALDDIDGVVPAPATLEARTLPEGFDRGRMTADQLKKTGLELADLLQVLADGRPYARHNAAVALGVMGAKAKDAAQPLSVAVKDTDPGVRAAAIEALAKLGSDVADTAARPLAKALSDRDPHVREAAQTALKELGPAALNGLVAELDIDPSTADPLLGAILALGAKAVPALLKALEHLSVRVRFNATVALGRLGPDHAKATRDAVEKLKSDRDDAVRKAAKKAVDAIDGVAPMPSTLESRALPDGFERMHMTADQLKKANLDLDQLITVLADGRPFARHNAAVALGTMGAKAKEAAPSLAVACKDGDPDVRKAAVTTLGKLGADVARDAAGPLARALSDNHREVREAARTALAELGPAAIEGLIAELDVDPGAADPVINAVTALGAKAVGPLVEALGHISVRVRHNAVSGLGRLGPDHAKTTRVPVSELSGDRDDGVRKAVRHALGILDGHTPAATVLEEQTFPEGFAKGFLNNDQLKKLSKDLEIDLLRRGLFDGRDPVRSNSARAVGLMGKKAEEAFSELLLCLKDTVPDVRTAAAEAIGVLKLDPNRAGPALVLALKGARRDTEEAILEALSSYGKAVVDPVLGLLRHRPEKFLKGFGKAARHMAKEFVKPLASMLDPEHNVVVRENAAEALSMVGREASSAEAALLTALEEYDILMRVKVIWAIGKCCKNSDKIRIKLREIKEADRRPEVRDAIDDAFMYLTQP